MQATKTPWQLPHPNTRISHRWQRVGITTPTAESDVFTRDNHCLDWPHVCHIPPWQVNHTAAEPVTLPADFPYLRTSYKPADCTSERHYYGGRISLGRKCRSCCINSNEKLSPNEGHEEIKIWNLIAVIYIMLFSSNLTSLFRVIIAIWEITILQIWVI